MAAGTVHMWIRKYLRREIWQTRQLSICPVIFDELHSSSQICRIFSLLHSNQSCDKLKHEYHYWYEQQWPSSLRFLHLRFGVWVSMLLCAWPQKYNWHKETTKDKVNCTDAISCKPLAYLHGYPLVLVSSHTYTCRYTLHTIAYTIDANCYSLLLFVAYLIAYTLFSEMNYSKLDICPQKAVGQRTLGLTSNPLQQYSLVWTCSLQWSLFLRGWKKRLHWHLPHWTHISAAGPAHSCGSPTPCTSCPPSPVSCWWRSASAKKIINPDSKLSR